MSVNGVAAYLPAVSETLAVKLNEPAEVGLPEICPDPDSATPGGRVPAITDQAYGGLPPVAANAAEYGVPILALGNGGAVVRNKGCRSGLVPSEAHPFNKGNEISNIIEKIKDSFCFPCDPDSI